MADLRTKYMGLELKNPIIVGASNLASNLQNLKRLEDAGAAAIVYKSVFEEQVQLENLEFYERKTEYEERHAEMITLFPSSKAEDLDIGSHLIAIKEAKQSVSIPVFASINALLNETWVDFAKQLEKTGVDGLELNFYTLPEKTYVDFVNIEKFQVEVLRDVKAAVKIPVSVKLSPFYTNPLKLISELDNAGADAVIMFNRLFQPDIDIQTEKHNFPYSLSNSEDNRLPLRFAGLVFNTIKASVCTNSGIIWGSDVIKMILAGSDAVQVVSTLYLNKLEVIGSMLDDIEKWMDKKGYSTIDSFKGKLSKKNSENKLPYERAQYIDFMANTSSILSKYKTIN
jgi:dihydroorotate dehydrogenase (fumarate)